MAVARRRIVGKTQKKLLKNTSKFETSAELAGGFNLPQYTLPRNRRSVNRVPGNIQRYANKTVSEK